MLFIVFLCAALIAENDAMSPPPVGSSGLKVYNIRIVTTDYAVLPNAPSAVPFRLTFFGENGEIGRYIPGGSEHKSTFQLSIAEMDLGTIYQASIYTTNMTDPWHVKMVNIQESATGRDYCFMFDKWIGWANSLIWSSCQTDSCNCIWPHQMNYMVMAVGPFNLKLKVQLYGTRQTAVGHIETGAWGDYWLAWTLPHLGDVQKIRIECRQTAEEPAGSLFRRILIGTGNQRNFHCFRFDRHICGSANSTQFLEKECQNIRCNCAM